MIADATLAGLDDYVVGYRDVFRRRDQLDRFRAYLRGLLDGDPARSVEAIAARHGGPGNGSAQALQHFVTSSPWDAERLLTAYRAGLGPRWHDPAAVWVVLDLAFPKKGRHSVGVQRQLARPLGRKVNCQVAVAVAQVGPAGVVPLGVRLYLPARWRTDAAGSKVETAVALLDRIATERPRPAGAVGDAGYRASPEFAAALADRGLPCLEEDDLVTRGLERFAWLERHLGLGRFEGRTWRGWHHHAGLVLAAFGFLAQAVN